MATGRNGHLPSWFVGISPHNIIYFQTAGCKILFFKTMCLFYLVFLSKNTSETIYHLAESLLINIPII